MRTKLTILISVIIFFLNTGCGFKVVNQSGLINFKIENILTSGDNRISYIIKNKLYSSDEFIKEYLNLFIELFFYKNINNTKNISFKIKKYFYLKLSFVKKYNLDFESFFLEFNDKLLSE